MEKWETDMRDFVPDSMINFDIRPREEEVNTIIL